MKQGLDLKISQFAVKHDDAERLFCLSLINSLGIITMDQMNAILGKYIQYRKDHENILEGMKQQ